MVADVQSRNVAGMAFGTAGAFIDRSAALAEGHTYSAFRLLTVDGDAWDADW